MSVHRIGFRAIAHATEDVGKVERALLFVSEAEDAVLTETQGHFGNTITVMEAALTRKREVKAFLSRLAEAGILEVLSKELNVRLDDDCTFHFRLDKQAAYTEILSLAGGIDFIDCSIKVAAYPAKRDVALKVLDDHFSELLTIAE